MNKILFFIFLFFSTNSFATMMVCNELSTFTHYWKDTHANISTINSKSNTHINFDNGEVLTYSPKKEDIPNISEHMYKIDFNNSVIIKYFKQVHESKWQKLVEKNFKLLADGQYETVLKIEMGFENTEFEEQTVNFFYIAKEDNSFRDIFIRADVSMITVGNCI